jgi:O-antigen/teichoic acid export membrane protein
MLVRAIVFIVTAVIQLAATAISFLLLLLAMNGYSERDATPGLLLYGVLGLFSAVGLGFTSASTSRHLAEKRAMDDLAASALSVLGFAIVGVIVLVIGFFLAIIVAEAMRGMR